jgi:hypothetical protein
MAPRLIVQINPRTALNSPRDIYLDDCDNLEDLEPRATRRATKRLAEAFCKNHATLKRALHFMIHFPGGKMVICFGCDSLLDHMESLVAVRNQALGLADLLGAGEELILDNILSHTLSLL